MTLLTILRIKCVALSHRVIVLLNLRLGLTVGLHNPENRDHQRDDREHNQRPIAGLLHRVRARVENIEQGSHRDQQNHNADRSLYGIYHKNTTLLYLSTVRSEPSQTLLRA